VRELGPDVALGLLTGEERAAALAHLEGCAACRAEVASLAGAADEVLLTAPEATPPAGFEARVLARLSEARGDEMRPAESVGLPTGTRYRPAHLRRPERRWRLAGGLAAAAAVVVVAMAVLVVRDGGSPSALTAEMTTSGGAVVGSATVHDGEPALVSVELPGWEFPASPSPNPYGSGYWLAVELHDGSRMMTPLTTEDTWWEVPVDADAGEVAAVSLLDGDGKVWCSAQFPA
jgi:hypothetical protein